MTCIFLPIGMQIEWIKNFTHLDKCFMNYRKQGKYKGIDFIKWTTQETR